MYIWLRVYLVAFSIAVLGIGIWHEVYFNNKSHHARAVIDSVNCNVVTNVCDLTVTYRVDGKTYTNTVQVITQETFLVGEVVTVSYDPNNPSDSHISTSSDDWLAPTLMALSGFAVLALAADFAYDLYRRRRTWSRLKDPAYPFRADDAM